jgi:thiamine pyrophosphokinase
MKLNSYLEFVNEAKIKPAKLTKEETKKVAETLAAGMAKAEKKPCKVNMKTLEEASFDLDLDGIEYDGGSFVIHDDGKVVNHAVTPNEVYGTVDSTVDEFAKNIKKPLKESEESIEEKDDRKLSLAQETIQKKRALEGKQDELIKKLKAAGEKDDARIVKLTRLQIKKIEHQIAILMIDEEIKEMSKK